MGVKGLIKPLDYHIEPEKYHQGKLGMTWKKIDTTYITHQFLSLLPTNIFFDKRKTDK